MHFVVYEFRPGRYCSLISKSQLHIEYLLEKGKSGYFYQDARICSTPTFWPQITWVPFVGPLISGVRIIFFLINHLLSMSCHCFIRCSKPEMCSPADCDPYRSVYETSSQFPCNFLGLTHGPRYIWGPIYEFVQLLF